MRSLLKFLLKNYAFLLFLLLEIGSLVLVFNYNSFQKAKFLNSSNYVSASLYNSVSSVLQYFELAQVNQQLAAENAQLLNQIEFNKLITAGQENSIHYRITASDSTYRFTAAKIINNSVNKQQNYITLNKGSKHGIKQDQGIISAQGIVGVVTHISESYSTGLSVLNPRWNVSAKLKKTGNYGTLSWDGQDYQFTDLLEIPLHVKLGIGDTIVTSGYSSIFPEGIMIGTIEEYEQPEGENYYDIKVRLATNFKSVRYVEVIEYIKKEEVENLENAIKDGQDSR